MNKRDSALMQRAFLEAARADWLFTAPNPRVGALAIKDGHVIGYGYYQIFGGAHAEERALHNAGAWDAEAGRMKPGIVDEIVVTLEPCSSHAQNKKRPRCSNFLLQAEVKRVVVGSMDPNPLHQGAAYPGLREAGVDIIEMGLEEQFNAMNDAFLGSLLTPDLPWILLKWASSVDGRTATPSGTSQWISGPEARAEVHQLRNLSQGVLAGKGTVLMDQPRLTARNGQGEPNLSCARLMVGCLQDIQPDHPVLQDAAPRFWIEKSAGTQPAWWRENDFLIETATTPDGRLDISAALKKCKTDYGLHRILVEGGSHIHASLLEAGLAHAIVRYEAPLLMFGGLAACEGKGVAEPQRGIHLIAEERRELGADLRRAFLLKSSL